MINAKSLVRYSSADTKIATSSFVHFQVAKIWLPLLKLYSKYTFEVQADEIFLWWILTARSCIFTQFVLYPVNFFKLKKVNLIMALKPAWELCCFCLSLYFFMWCAGFYNYAFVFYVFFCIFTALLQAFNVFYSSAVNTVIFQWCHIDKVEWIENNYS